VEPSDFERMTLDELRRYAGARGIAGAASLDRDQLLAALTGSAPGSRGGRLDVPSSTFARPIEHETETMARLYYTQGLPDRAAEIYRKLLAREPDNAQLAARLAEAEAAFAGVKRATTDASARSAAAGQLVAPLPASGEPFGMLDFEELPEGYGVDECELIARDPFHLFAYWEVTDGGLDVARRHLGDDARDARLILRVFTIAAEALARGVTRDTRDHALDSHRGRRYLPSLRPGAQVRAAVGLVAGSGLFAPIAHSSTVRIPPTEPAPPSPGEWIEVEPARSGGREREPVKILRGPGTVVHSERGVTPPGAPGAAEGGPYPSSPGKRPPSSGSRD
jgi:hypothetical protein